MVNIINNESYENLQEKTKLYINVFGEEPRNEWFECKNDECDKQYYALSKIYAENISHCLNCSTQLEKVYDQNILEQDRQKWASKEWYVWRLAEKNAELIGFILWWNDTITSLNDEKFDLKKPEIERLETNIKNICPDFNLNNFYYFSEIWINKDHRWTDDHIAWRLYRSMEEQVIKNGKEYLILRTTQKSDLPFKWFQKLWYNVVFNYNDENDRVIMIKKIQKILI